MLERQQLQPRNTTPYLNSSAALDALQGVHLSVIRYPERMAEILQLRRTAYRTAHKIAEATTMIEMFDERDPLAWIVIAESEGKIVGCLRLNPPPPGAILGQAALGESVPGLPPRSDYLECSRACIHPEYQGSGLCWHLAAHMLILAHRLGKPYLIAGIDASLWRFWRRCGWRKIGVPYINSVFSDLEHEMGILDVDASLAGQTTDPKLCGLLPSLPPTADSTAIC